MKKAILFFITILLSSCTNPEKTKKETAKKTENQKVERNINLDKTSVSTKNDSIINNRNESSCIKITKVTLLKNHYSDHKDIKVVFKNLGKKSIKAIKFEWSCVNSFEEPASGKYFYGEGKFKENSTHLIKPGETRTEYWEDFSTDASKITEIRAYYIVYTDGTKWEFYKDDYTL